MSHVNHSPECFLMVNLTSILMIHLRNQLRFLYGNKGFDFFGSITAHRKCRLTPFVAFFWDLIELLDLNKQISKLHQLDLTMIY